MAYWRTYFPLPYKVFSVKIYNNAVYVGNSIFLVLNEIQQVGSGLGIHMHVTVLQLKVVFFHKKTAATFIDLCTPYSKEKYV